MSVTSPTLIFSAALRRGWTRRLLVELSLVIATARGDRPLQNDHDGRPAGWRTRLRFARIASLHWSCGSTPRRRAAYWYAGRSGNSISR